MNKIILALLAFTVLIGVSPRTADARCNVIDWGAIPNDGLGDRAAVQDAIDYCHAAHDADVYFPPGEYLLEKAPFFYWSITVPSGTRLFGDNPATTILKMPANTVGSHRLLYVYGTDTKIESLTLDGDRTHQTRIPEPGSEHRHGIFAVNTTRLSLVAVTAREFTGDGVYLYQGSDQTTVRDCNLIDNDRSGIALATDLDKVLIVANRIMRNGVQQIDTEPVNPSNVNEVVITGNFIDGSGSNSYAITLSGPQSYNLSKGFTVSGNVILGGIFVVWAEYVTITGNVIFNHTTQGAVDIYRTARRVAVIGNTIFHTWIDTEGDTSGVASLSAIGTGTGHLPEDVLFKDNVVYTADADGFGVRLQGILSGSVQGNTFIGSGQASTYGAGVYVRTTSVETPTRFVDISNNLIRNYGKYAILVNGNGTARIRAMRITGNLFEDTSSTHTQTIGARLDDGSHPLEHFTVLDNFCLDGVITCVDNIPSGATVVVPASAVNTGWISN